MRQATHKGLHFCSEVTELLLDRGALVYADSSDAPACLAGGVAMSCNCWPQHWVASLLFCWHISLSDNAPWRVDQASREQERIISDHLVRSRSSLCWAAQAVCAFVESLTVSALSPCRLQLAWPLHVLPSS